MERLRLLGLSAIIVPCRGGGDDGLSPAPPEKDMIPVSVYNGIWVKH
jgi:hypothetical protein